MAKKTVPFQGTKEQEEKLLEMIRAHKGEKGALMPILQQAQDIYGYLPIEVATFYAQFALQPKGKYRISVCLGTACYVKGSGQIYDKLQEVLQIQGGECTPDGKFSLEACRCVGACGLAPVMMVNDDVHGRLTADDVQGIIDKYNA